MEVDSNNVISRDGATHLGQPSLEASARYENSQIQERICAALFERSIAAPPPPGWSKFGGSKYIRQFSSGTAQLLTELTPSFSDDELLLGGAAVRNEHGELTLAKVLDT